MVPPGTFPAAATPDSCTVTFDTNGNILPPAVDILGNQLACQQVIIGNDPGNPTGMDWSTAPVLANNSSQSFTLVPRKGTCSFTTNVNQISTSGGYSYIMEYTLDRTRSTLHGAISVTEYFTLNYFKATGLLSGVRNEN